MPAAGIGTGLCFSHRPGLISRSVNELRSIFGSAVVGLYIADDIIGESTAESWPARIGSTATNRYALHPSVRYVRGRKRYNHQGGLASLVADTTTPAEIWGVGSPGVLPFNGYPWLIGTALNDLSLDGRYLQGSTGTSAWFAGGGTRYRDGTAGSGVISDLAVYACVGSFNIVPTKKLIFGSDPATEADNRLWRGDLCAAMVLGIASTPEQMSAGVATMKRLFEIP